MRQSLEIRSQHFPTLRPPDLRDFEVLSKVARENAGLVLSPDKATMVFARVARRLRALGIEDRSAYCRIVADETNGHEERRQLVNVLTTHVTDFFREKHHFDFLRKNVVPNLIRRAHAGERVRVWSAGCSTGQEPFSIAIELLENLPEAPSLDVKILATDIDDQVLKFAKKGVYSEPQLASVPNEFRQRYFSMIDSPTKGERYFRIESPLEKMVSFRELNLVSHWPMNGLFDVIFCRNVVIYFDRCTQHRLGPRLQRACAAGGYLFLGHSERLYGTGCTEFSLCGTTTYRRSVTPTIGTE